MQIANAMPRAHLARVLLAAALLVPATLGVWALSEARSQRREIEQALRAEATLLARTLGPALASASASARELDELLAWKLLDNARLLARLPVLPADRPLAPSEFENLLEANGIDAALWLSPNGEVTRRAGARFEDLDDGRLRAALAPLLAGEAEELIVGSVHEGAGPMAAAVRTDRGTAVAVIADPAGAFAFTRQIGVSNLLRRLLDTDAVLYLAYDEKPGGAHAEAAWDRQPVPPALTSPAAEVRGRPVFEVSLPVSSPAGRSATLRVGLNGAPLARAAASAMRRTALVGTVLAAFCLASVAFAVVQRTRSREREEARRRMAELEERRRQSERLATAGALAAGLAHEVRNPLNGIAMAAQRIERLGTGDRHSDRARELAALIRQEVVRLEGTLAEFLDLARPASGSRRSIDLGDVTRDALALLELEAAEKNVRIERRLSAVPVVADPAALRGAVLNLVRNAIQASAPESRIEIEAGVTLEGLARVSVRDRGEGIDPAMASHVFDPFVTTRASGTGLGLAMVRRVTEEHGGRAWLTSRPGGGVEVCFEIPAAAPARRAS
ncbi:MAG TPA: ATP-binding protein [Thermoanaerobaculia bacterium]|nr:ATP-binding protein [Thermoanaerobaculia bacterium]